MRCIIVIIDKNIKYRMLQKVYTNNGRNIKGYYIGNRESYMYFTKEKLTELIKNKKIQVQNLCYSSRNNRLYELNDNTNIDDRKLFLQHLCDVIVCDISDSYIPIAIVEKIVEINNRKNIFREDYLFIVELLNILESFFNYMQPITLNIGDTKFKTQLYFKNKVFYRFNKDVNSYNSNINLIINSVSANTWKHNGDRVPTDYIYFIKLAQTDVKNKARLSFCMDMLSKEFFNNICMTTLGTFGYVTYTTNLLSFVLNALKLDTPLQITILNKDDVKNKIKLKTDDWQNAYNNFIGEVSTYKQDLINFVDRQPNKVKDLINVISLTDRLTINERNELNQKFNDLIKNKSKSLRNIRKFAKESIIDGKDTNFEDFIDGVNSVTSAYENCMTKSGVLGVGVTKITGAILNSYISKTFGDKTSKVLNKCINDCSPGLREALYFYCKCFEYEKKTDKGKMYMTYLGHPAYKALWEVIKDGHIYSKANFVEYADRKLGKKEEGIQSWLIPLLLIFDNAYDSHILRREWCSIYWYSFIETYNTIVGETMYDDEYNGFSNKWKDYLRKEYSWNIREKRDFNIDVKRLYNYNLGW